VLEKIAAVPERGVEQAFEVLRQQTRHLSRMVDDLNDLSRITQGKLDVRLQTIPLLAAVSDAVSVTRPRMDRRGQHLRVDIPDEPLEVGPTRCGLTQLLANLLTTRRSTTPDGGDIRPHRLARRCAARVTFATTVSGSPAQAARHLHAFTQVRRRAAIRKAWPRTRPRRATGRPARPASVAASVRPRKGSEFTVRLPVERA